MNQIKSFVAIFALYVALALVSLAIISGTCTMASDDTLAGATLISPPFYILAILLFSGTQRSQYIFYLSMPSIPVLTWHLYWFIGLFINTNIQGKSVCTWKMDSNFGFIHGLREYLYAPYFIFLTVSILALLYFNHKACRGKSIPAFLRNNKKTIFITCLLYTSPSPRD